jgi:hypothetical protein
MTINYTNYVHINVPPDVLETVEQITGALVGKVFYAEDGEVLILTDEDTYIIAVTPNDTKFNGGNPTTMSAYLYAEKPEYNPDNACDDEAVMAEPGWSSGYEC